MDKNEKDVVKLLETTSPTDGAGVTTTLAKTAGVDNDDRKPRSFEEMAKEAANLRRFFKQYDDIWA